MIGNSTSIDALIAELTSATEMKFDHYQRKFLEKRIDFRMKHLNLEDYRDYINYIRKNPLEIEFFLDKFTINYTYFFRNITVFQNFEKFIKIYFKNLIGNRKILKIWSAPCATGDEPFSLAMVLDQLKEKNKNFPDFKIYASDIDTNAIKIASEGVYGEYAVHELPEHYLSTYFSKEITALGPNYSINNKIKSKVEFIREDIIKGHQGNQVYDAIFCRNFFIYINEKARTNLLNNIERRLFEGGLLVLGGSETLPSKNTAFKRINVRDRFFIKDSGHLNNLYKNKMLNLFEKSRIKEVKKKKDRLRKTEIQRDKIDTRGKVKKPKKKIEESERDLKRDRVKSEENQRKVPEIQRKEIAEVRFTKIVVNNGLNGSLKNTEVNTQSESEADSIKNDKIITMENLEKSLKRRELILNQKENNLDQKIEYLKEQQTSLEQERKITEEILKQATERENEVINRTLVLERITRQLKQRKQNIKQRELQLEKRLNQIEQYSRQMIQQEIQITRYSNKVEDKKESDENINPFEDGRIDRVKNPNNEHEQVIPKGYYSLINSFDKDETSTKFVVNGLGAGIALILKDPINNIFAMSHISLPSSGASKQGYHLLFPHTFVDTSIKDLYNNLIYNGGNNANIKALVVGGAKLFLDYDMTYLENLDAVRKEISSLQIAIEAEDTGGLSERSVIFDTINDSLFVKKTWEFEFRKIT